MGPQPTSGMEYVDTWRTVNRMRAFENNVYLIGPHWADSPNTESLVAEGHSMIVDFNGQILTESDGAREHFVIARSISSGCAGAERTNATISSPSFVPNSMRASMQRSPAFRAARQPTASAD